MLGYTSQLVHALQVYAAVSNATDIIFDERDAQYRRDMRLAALIHDLGKLLSLFGEADAHVDCTNSALAVDGDGGLDAIRAQFNHDEYGYLKLRGLGLPRRVELVIRFHSLFDLRNTTVPDDHAMPWLQPADEPLRHGPKPRRRTRPRLHPPLLALRPEGEARYGLHTRRRFAATAALPGGSVDAWRTL